MTCLNFFVLLHLYTAGSCITSTLHSTGRSIYLMIDLSPNIIYSIRFLTILQTVQSLAAPSYSSTRDAAAE
jgi:hypothetical protein